MKKQSTIALMAVTALACNDSAFAHEKDKYNLFNPTPKEEMRGFITDRPDKTESPYSVDAGHFQIETDIATLTRTHYKKGGENTRTRSDSIMFNNFKLGLTNNIDLQILAESYVNSRTTDKNTATTEKASGFGDVTARLKYNIWGNDGGDTSLGIMPFVKLPTNQDNLGNNDVEGGVIVPYAIALPENYALGMMTQVNWNKEADDSGYAPEFVNSITLGIPMPVDGLGMYTELWTSKSTDTGADWQASFDVGLTYVIIENLQLDAGLNTGLTEATDDYNPFIGFSWRY
jgi:hypothetical protein